MASNNLLKNLSDLPHYDLIRENEIVELRSVFDFKGGSEELFPFLYGCQQLNCVIVFKNEEITVYPKDAENKPMQNLLLSFYAMIAKDPKIANDYIRYLCICDGNPGERVKGQHEAILEVE